MATIPQWLSRQYSRMILAPWQSGYGGVMLLVKCNQAYVNQISVFIKVGADETEPAAAAAAADVC